jgi:hypothetical protein
MKLEIVQYNLFGKTKGEYKIQDKTANQAKLGSFLTSINIFRKPEILNGLFIIFNATF